MDEITVTRLINGPEAFTPDNEFCLGESEVRGFFVAAGFCAHGLAGAGGDRQGDGRVDRRRRAVARPLAHGHPPLRPALPLAVVHAQAHEGGLRDLLRHPLPGPRARRPAGRCACRAPTSWHRAHGAEFGEKSGWERVNWYESNAAAGDESLRPRGWAGMLWSPAIGAEHRATREAAGLFDESSFAKLEVSGPGAAELLERLCDNRVAREVGQITYTQMLNRRGGIECDFTVVAAGRGPLRDRHRHRLRQPRRELDPRAPARRRLGQRHGRHRALGLLRPVGPARARRPRAADAGPARLRLHAPARDHGRRRAGARAAGHLRRRARLGALLPDRVRRRPVALALRGRASRTGCAPAATARSTRCGSRRATACGRPTSRPTTRRSRRGSGSACARDKEFIGSDALARAGAAAARDHAGRPARGRARQRAGARRRRDRRARDERRLRLHGGALDRLRLPAGGRSPRAPRSRSTSSASGCRARSRPSRCSTRRERGSADDRATVMLASARRRARAGARAVWLVSCALRDASIIDVVWGLGFIVIGWVCVARRPRRARPPAAARDARDGLGRCGSPATSAGATSARARTAATPRCASATASASG